MTYTLAPYVLSERAPIVAHNRALCLAHLDVSHSLLHGPVVRLLVTQEVSVVHPENWVLGDQTIWNG